MDKNLEKVLDYVTKEEERYYNYSFKCMDEGNTTGQFIHTAEASAFQRVRYFIEVLLENQ